MSWAAQIEMFPARERARKRCVWVLESQDGAIALCGAVAYWQAKNGRRLTLCDQHKQQADEQSRRPRGFEYLGELSDASHG